MWKKLELPCTSARVAKAFSKYKDCEHEVAEKTQELLVGDQDHLSTFRSISSLLWDRALLPLDRKIYKGEGLLPKHGPGATADGLKGNHKFKLQQWPRRLDVFFPSSLYLIPSENHWDLLDRVDFVEPGYEMPVKVISVPKTLKTPRIIGVEPTGMQYAQQALLRELVPILENKKLFSGSLGFTDQEPNKVLAKTSSRTQEFATLDLSDASDRVSNLLVKEMLHNLPSLSGALQACRSSRAEVPGQGTLALTKFASMGSAVTFPVEAMVFLTIVVIGYQRQLSRPLTHKDVKRILKRVRIYGDDIIIPVELVPYVTSALHDYGSVVNAHKSFWTGRFRESCGGDYYDGADVTPVYVRRVFPESRRDTKEFVSCVSLRNQLYKAGLWNAAAYLDTQLEGMAPFPVVAESSPALGRHSFLGYSQERLCRNLHRPLVWAAVQVAKKRPSKLDGAYALMKYFLKEGDEPFFDKEHLSYYGRPLSVDTKIRWAPAT
jgi:hypothetical protein